MKFATRLVIAILFPLGCFAQFSVTGKVLDKAGVKPVANASVFINNTTFGDKTADDGSFILKNLKPGRYELVISIIGFDTYKQTLVINAGDVKLPGIKIHARVTALKEVTIKASGNAYRDIYYNRFREEFLGKSSLAQETKILNPESLYFDFDEKTNTLTASSPGFLEVENNALGYKISYLLTNFTLNGESPADKEVHYEGSVMFKEMNGTPGQKRRWQEQRHETYEGSILHFLRSAMSDRLDEDGFRVLQLAVYANPDRPSDSLVRAKIKQFDVAHYYQKDLKNPDSLAFWKKKEKLLKLPKIIRTLMPFQLSKGDIMNPTQDGLVALGCDSDKILIVYNKSHRFRETARLADFNNLNYILNRADDKDVTLINFADPYAFIGHNGSIINPNSLVFNGAWGRNRVADLLPVNYEPPVNDRDNNDTLLKKDTILRNNIAKIGAYSVSRPFEKVYLHLNKPRYDVGDTIWFKAYTVIGEKHQLSALSGVLYAELIDPKDSVVKRLTLPLISGVGWGEFTIPRRYKPGSYQVRAYTNWMRNEGASYFYNQKVQIGGLQLASLSKQNEVSNPDVQFFPEGGELVNGIRCRVAIKAVSADGLGKDVKGTIEDNEGNVVADFATQHLGMGVFALTPQSGKTYRAKISGQGEAGFTVDLPKAVERGYSLALNNMLKDSLYLKVAVNEKLFKEKQSTNFYLVAQSGGKVFYTAAGKLVSPVFTATIEKSRFPSGIVQFTLFSDSGEPVNERIVFIQNDDSVKLNIHTSQATYTTRQPVKIMLDASDNTSKPVAGSFSAAVINESRVGLDENTESTIINNLLLTSELTGNIEQPNYYFANSNEQTRADLDVLMLTQGYRRFAWREVLNPVATPIAYQPEKSLELSGTLKTRSGAPVPNGKITLMSTRDNVLRDTTTDASGNFKFDNLYLPDTAKIILRARKAHNGSNVAIYVKQQDYPAVVKQKQQGASLPPELAAILQKNYAVYRQQQIDDSLQAHRQLKEVKITGRKIAKPDIYNRYGAALEYDVDMKRLAAEFINIKEALIYVIPGMSYVRGQFWYEHQRVGLFIVDGFERPVNDFNYFSPNEIESIRMIDSTGLTPATLILTTKRYAGTDMEPTIKLKQVTIHDSKIKADPFLTRSSNLHGGGNADQVIMGDQLGIGCVNISDCLIGKINGVVFRADGHPVNPRRGKTMSVIVDGVVLNGSHLNELVASDIYSIEVLRSGAAISVYGSSIEGGGALVITMKHGGESGKNVTADTTVLKQVNIKATKLAKKPELTNSSNLNGAGHADQVITGDKLTDCITLSDCLNGKVFGVTFASDGTPYSTRPKSFSGTPPMVVIIDGNIMAGNHLNELNASDISSIEVLRSGVYLAVYGSNAPGGALVITTKRGETNFVTSETPAGLITYPFNGFYKARTFYSPKYTASKTAASTPDLRNAIYWNPNIITDKDGRASFEYFNNDTKGSYRVVVEGIDDNGNLYRQVYRYKVE